MTVPPEDIALAINRLADAVEHVAEALTDLADAHLRHTGAIERMAEVGDKLEKFVPLLGVQPGGDR